MTRGRCFASGRLAYGSEEMSALEVWLTHKMRRFRVRCSLNARALS